MLSTFKKRSLPESGLQNGRYEGWDRKGKETEEKKMKDKSIQTRYNFLSITKMSLLTEETYSFSYVPNLGAVPVKLKLL